MGGSVLSRDVGIAGAPGLEMASALEMPMHSNTRCLALECEWLANGLEIDSQLR